MITWLIDGFDIENLAILESLNDKRMVWASLISSRALGTSDKPIQIIEHSSKCTLIMNNTLKSSKIH